MTPAKHFMQYLPTPPPSSRCTMPDDPSHFVPTEKMQQSYVRWCNIPIIEKKKCWAMYWEYIGESWYSNKGWMLTEHGVRRIDYLLGPYAATMVIAWYKTGKPKPQQDPL